MIIRNDISNLLFIISELVINVVSVVGNSVILVCVCRFRFNHKIQDVFLTNLVMADIAVGVTNGVIVTLSFHGLPHSVCGCILLNTCSLIFANVSIFMHIAIFSERVLFTVSHETYYRYLSVNRASLISTYIWVLGSVIGVIPLFLLDTKDSTLPICTFFAVISLQFFIYCHTIGISIPSISFIGLSYFYIVTALLRRQIETANSPQFIVFRNTPRRLIRAETEDERMRKMLGLLLVVFSLCWGPFTIISLFKFICPECEYPDSLNIVAVILIQLISAIHPFLYITSHNRIARGLIEIFIQETTATTTSSESDIHNSLLLNHQKTPVVGPHQTDGEGKVSRAKTLPVKEKLISSTKT